MSSQARRLWEEDKRISDFRFQIAEGKAQREGEAHWEGEAPAELRLTARREPRPPVFLRYFTGTSCTASMTT